MKLDKVIQSVILGIIILIPIVFWPDFQTVFTIPKLLILRILSAVALILFLLKLFLAKKVTFKKSPIYLALGLILASAVISTFFSINAITSLFGQYSRFVGLFSLLNFLLLPIIIINTHDKAAIARALKVSTYTATAVAIFGLLQYFNFFGLPILELNWTDSPQNRVFSTAGHANHLAAYLVTNILIALFTIKKLPLKFALTIPMLVTLFLTGSRGALIALIIAGLILLFRNKPKKIALTISVLLLIIAGLFTLSSTPLIKRTNETIQSISLGYTPERISFLASAGQMWLDHPIAGTGYSTFRDAFSQYRQKNYLIAGPGNAQYITVPEAAHNILADTLATTGLLGLAALIYLFYIAIRTQKNPALLAIILVFGLQALFNFGEILNLTFFWLAIGFIGAEHAGKQLKLSMHKIVKIFAALIVLSLTFLFLYDGVFNLARADIRLKQATYKESQQEFLAAEDALIKAVQAYPIEYSIHQKLADLALQIAVISQDSVIKNEYLEKAIYSYQNALKLNDHYSSTHHNLALTHIYKYRQNQSVTDLELARNSYQNAIDNSPNNARYHYEFARKLHADFAEIEESIKYLNQALAINSDYQEPKDYLNFLRENHPELF